MKACILHDSIYRMYLGHYHVHEIHPFINDVFFHVTTQHLTACICHDLFMYSLVGGPWGCVQ